MSTILDALKKSEAERSAGTANRTPERPPSTARPARRWSALIVVAAAGIVAGVLVSQWAASPPGSAELPSGPASSPLPSAPTPAPQSAQAQATSRPATGAAPAPTTGEVDAAPTATAADSQAAPANAASTGSKSALSAVTSQTPAASADDSGKAPEKSNGAAPSLVDVAPSLGDVAPPAVPERQQQNVARGGGGQTAAPRRQPAERLPGYEQLPALQQQLGDLALSMLVFSNDPGQRFALINGQRLHNGEALASGATLVEIRRAGCVLEYHGQRFLLAVAR